MHSVCNDGSKGVSPGFSGRNGSACGTCKPVLFINGPSQAAQPRLNVSHQVASIFCTVSNSSLGSSGCGCPALAMLHTAVMLLQYRCTQTLAVDIHPAARIGKGVLLDHGTGLVIGETAVVGNNVSILHNVTLGGGPGLRCLACTKCMRSSVKSHRFSPVRVSENPRYFPSFYRNIYCSALPGF